MSGGINKGFGFNTGSGGEADTNTNVANANLTSDGNHTLDVAATTLTIDSGAVDMAKFNGSTNKITFGPSGDDYTFPDERPGATGDVLGASDTSGTLEWVTPTPNTNTNVANADLTLDASHTTDVGSNVLTFDSGTTNIAKMVGSDNTLQVGGANPYKLPTVRAGVIGSTLQSTDATTGTAFIQNGFTIPFRMYADGYNAATWWYPEAMTNNKALALTRTSGFSSLQAVNLTTPNVLRSAIALPGGNATVRDISFWSSCVDTQASLAPNVVVRIYKFTPTNIDPSNLVGTVIAEITTGSGDNNSRLYRGNGAPIAAAVASLTQYEFLMPMFRLDFEEVPDEMDFDVFINGSISLYYNS